MTVTSLTGNDTVILNDRVFADFADANIANLTFPNDLVNVKTGKNGNSIYAFNETGRQCDVEIRIMRGSSDDKYLNSQLLAMKNDPPSFVLFRGQFVKRVGDGNGNITQEIYSMSGGIFTREVDVSSNVEGETEQAVAIYRLKFTNAPRSL